MNDQVRTIDAWLDTNFKQPSQDGWYLAVLSGHGKTRMLVDYYDIDDVQWNEEQKDSLVSITHYQALPHLPFL